MVSDHPALVGLTADVAPSCWVSRLCRGGVVNELGHLGVVTSVSWRGPGNSAYGIVTEDTGFCGA